MAGSSSPGDYIGDIEVTNNESSFYLLSEELVVISGILLHILSVPVTQKKFFITIHSAQLQTTWNTLFICRITKIPSGYSTLHSRIVEYGWNIYHVRDNLRTYKQDACIARDRFNIYTHNHTDLQNTKCYNSCSPLSTLYAARNNNNRTTHFFVILLL